MLLALTKFPEDIPAHLPNRPDDSAGVGFQRQLEGMRRRVARCKPKPAKPMPNFEWELEEIEPEDAEEWLMSAQPPGYYLVAAQLQEPFLKNQPPESPRLSWCFSTIREGGARVVMGGQAPNWRVAQARAEAIWRLAANIRVDA
jgi:hypothetical protein